jgi:integrase
MAKYHDYDKNAFCITDYSDKNRPHLKRMVRCKVAGKWARRFFKNEREAKTYVDLRRIELRNHGEEGIMFPAELRVMAQRAKDQLEPFGKTIDDALDFYIKHLAADSRSIPVRQAVDELIANRRHAGLSKLYCGDLQFRLGRFAKAFPERTVASITTKEIVEWLESLDVGPVTRNTFRRDVRTLFSFCGERNYCADNPASTATRAKEPSKEVEVLSVENARRLLAASSPEMLPYWAIGLFAGLRPSEIRHLQWNGDVDLDDALITVRSSKTGRKRFVTIQPNLLAWLTPHRRHEGRVVSPVNFRRQRAEDKAAAGLGGDWPVNGMRHSFGSYWLAQFNDINALAAQMGNSPEVIEKHYRKAVKPKEAHRYWGIKPVAPADVAEKVVAMPAVG